MKVDVMEDFLQAPPLMYDRPNGFDVEEWEVQCYDLRLEYACERGSAHDCIIAWKRELYGRAYQEIWRIHGKYS